VPALIAYRLSLIAGVGGTDGFAIGAEPIGARSAHGGEF
jgi:hypothetical protein